MMMKPRKPKTLKIQTQVHQLSNELSFLDVLRDACAHNGRYTLNVEANGQVYTVLVDRGGPFNAIGGGTAGTPALVAASQLRSGRCTIAVGWPVAQPLYQPGLDLTLRALVEGAVAPSSLPRHRGVDSLRNAEWRQSDAVAPANQTRQRPIPPPAPVTSVGPVAAPAPPAAPSGMTLQLEPEGVQPEPAQPQPQPVPTAFPTRPWVHSGAENEVVMAALGRTDKVLPAHDRDGAALEGAKRFATQALLWLCEVEESRDYTLPEAAALARHNLVEGIAQGLHPLRRDMSSRIDKVKKDWAHSGDVASRSKHKKRAKAVRPTDPDEEFRLF